MEDLFGARLKNLGENPPGHDPWFSSTDTRHLDRFVLVDHRGERAAASTLDLFRVGNWRSKTDGDVVGEVIASHRHDPGVPKAAAFEDRKVGRAAADVHDGDSQFLLVLRQYRLTCS